MLVTVISTTHSTLLQAAKSFIKKSAGAAVLAVAPLAAVQLTSSARAQVIFDAPSSPNVVDVGTDPGMDIDKPVSNYFNATLPVAENGRAGTLLGASTTVTVNQISGGNFVRQSLSFGLSGGGTLPAGSIPVAYDFVLSSTGNITGFRWELWLVTDTDAGPQMLASGNLSLATPVHVFGTSAYEAGAGSPYSFYDLSLATEFNAEEGASVSIAMNQSAGQGIALNATAVPEPSTYAAIAGAMILGLAILRRAKRPLAA